MAKGYVLQNWFYWEKQQLKIHRASKKMKNHWCKIDDHDKVKEKNFTVKLSVKNINLREKMLDKVWEVHPNMGCIISNLYWLLTTQMPHCHNSIFFFFLKKASLTLLLFLKCLEFD